MTGSDRVERRDEIRRRLEAAVRGLRPDTAGHVVILEGQAGIGKSRLLHRTVGVARSAGLDIAQVRAGEKDRRAPLSTLRALVASRFGPTELPGDPFATVDAVRSVLVPAARRSPLLIVVDDVHLVDELSAWALRQLTAALAGAPVLWLLAGRPAEVRRWVRECLDHLPADATERLAVPPLGADETRALCAELLGGRPGARALRLARRAGGVPYLLVDLFGTLARTGRVEHDGGGGVDVVGEDLPSEFGDTIGRHLGELSADARRLLDAAAVLAQPFSPDEVAGLLDVAPPAVLLDTIEEALHADLLREEGDELRFRHDLIREAVYDRLPPERRVSLHRTAARVVEAQGRSAAEVSEHVLRSGDPADDTALELVHAAVADLGAAAPGTAADLVMRTLGLVDGAHPARPSLIADAVRLFAQAGQVCEARELGESELVGCGGPAARVPLLLALSVAHFLSGYADESVALSARALRDCGTGDDSLADVLAIRSHALLDQPDPPAAATTAERAREVAVRTGQHASQVCATAVLGAAVRAAGRLDDAVALGREAVQLVETVGGETRHRIPRLWLIGSLLAVDRFDEADAVAALGQQEAERLGTAWSGPAWHYFRAQLRLAAGRLDDAWAEAERGVDRADRTPVGSHLVALHHLLAEVAVLAGDLAGARRHRELGDGLTADGLGPGPEFPGWAAGLCLLADGRHADAFAVLGPLCHDPSQLRLLLVREPRVAAWLVRLARVTGGADADAAADAVVGTAAELAASNPGVAGLAGAAAHAAGVRDDDPDALRTAADHYRVAGRPLARAAAVCDAALARPDRSGRLVELLREARGAVVAAGAGWDAERIEPVLAHAEELARAGSDTGADARPDEFPGGGERGADRVDGPGEAVAGSAGPADTGPPGTAVAAEAAAGWAELTRSELRVVRLVAQGMTNREVAAELHLSRHTVDSHLRHAFTKLGVTSRVELTRLVLELDPAPV